MVHKGVCRTDTTRAHFTCTRWMTGPQEVVQTPLQTARADGVGFATLRVIADGLVVAVELIHSAFQVRYLGLGRPSLSLNAERSKYFVFYRRESF